MHPGQAGSAEPGSATRAGLLSKTRAGLLSKRGAARGTEQCSAVAAAHSQSRTAARGFTPGRRTRQPTTRVAPGADQGWEPVMLRPHQQRLRSSSQTVIPQSGQQADVIELIMADHRRIRRFREVLDDAIRCGRGSGWMLAHVWQRFSGLLEAHARGEEEICYLPMFGASPRPGEWRAAVADHDDIREAIGEAALHPVGSALWWGAARSVLTVIAGHLEREERDMLTGWLPRLTMRRRRELGSQWLAFAAAWRLDAAPEARLNVPAPRGLSRTHPDAAHCGTK